MARRLTNKQIVEAYQKKGCNISSACIALKIARKTFYDRRKKNKKLDEALTEIEESLLDFAESKLLEKVQEGDNTCLIFYLKTKGKDRGYVERIDQNVTVNPFMELMQAATSQDGK